MQQKSSTIGGKGSSKSFRKLENSAKNLREEGFASCNETQK